MSKAAEKFNTKDLRKQFAYAREIERTSVITGKNGSALDLQEYNEAYKSLSVLRTHVLQSPFYTSVMAPSIVQPSLRSRGVDLSPEEIRSVLYSDPMKGSAPALKLILDTPDLHCHKAGVAVRISEKTKPSGKKIEQAVKIDIGFGNHDRLEFEDLVKKPNSENPPFSWDMLQNEEQSLLRDILEIENLNDLNLRVWMFLFGSNWQTEYMPEGNTDILIKQKHDRYHIRDIFGWEAYVAKAEIEADQDHLTKMLASGAIKPKDHINDIQKTLDDIQRAQIERFSDVFEQERRSIYQRRFDEIAQNILPELSKKGTKTLAKNMGRKRFKTVDLDDLGL